MEYRHEVCVRRLQKENQVTVVFLQCVFQCGVISLFMKE